MGRKFPSDKAEKRRNKRSDRSRVMAEAAGDAEAWNLDRIGRHVAQLLADDSDDMHVTTYGVCADVVHVTCPDGSRFHIELTPEADD